MDSGTNSAPAWQGWGMVVVSGLIMGMGWGTQMTVSVFITPLTAEFGWARGEISFAYTLATVCSGFAGIVSGHMADRISPRRQVLAGAVIMGVAYMLLSRTNNVWHLYVLYGLVVGGMCQGAFMVPLLTNVAFWFDRQKGLALGVTMAGQSLGAAMVPLLARTLITELGWRQAYVALGIFTWAALIPLALLVRQAPGIAAARAKSLREGSLARNSFGLTAGSLTWVLSAAIVCCCTCMAIPSLHVVSLAIDRGISVQGAASVLTVLMVVSIVGRVGIGKVADWIGGLRALLLASFTQTAMVFWFTQVNTLPGFYLIALFYAVGFGGVVPAYTIIIRELIPAHRIGGTMGIVMFFGNVGMGLGGYLGGLLFDLSGSYVISFSTAAAAGSVNLAIVGGLLLYLRSRQPALPEPEIA